MNIIRWVSLILALTTLISCGGGEIKAVLVADSSVTPPPTTTFTATEVDLDIVRFLNQATFGATPEDYAAARELL